MIDERAAVEREVEMVSTETVERSRAVERVDRGLVQRQVELASLRSLGVTHNEVARMLTVENAACVALGVAMGVPAGIAAVRAIIASFQSDLITYQFYIAPGTLLTAVVFTATLAMLSQIPALRLLRGMNLAQMTRLHGE